MGPENVREVTGHPNEPTGREEERRGGAEGARRERLHQWFALGNVVLEMHAFKPRVLAPAAPLSYTDTLHCAHCVGSSLGIKD